MSALRVECRHPGEHTRGLPCPDCGRFSAHSWATQGFYGIDGWQCDYGGHCATHGEWSDSA